MRPNNGPRLLLALFLLSLLASTNAWAAPSADRALTDPQSARVKAVLTSMNDWNVLIKHELTKKSATPESNDLMAVILATDPTPASGGINQTAVDNDCEINVTPPAQKGVLQAGDDGSAQTKLAKFTVDIVGAKCPIQLHGAIDGIQQPDGLTAKFVIDAKVLDATMKAQNDITDYHVSMDIVGKVKKGDAGAAHMDVTISASGNSLSQKEGKVDQGFTMAMGMDMKPPPPGTNGFPDLKMTMSEALHYSFQDVAIDMKSTVHLLGLMGPSDEDDYVNGVKVTPEEYKAYRSLIEVPTDKGSVGDPNANNQPPGPNGPPQPQPVNPAGPMSCDVSVYKAADVSKDQLNSSISSQVPVAAVPVFHTQQCSQNGSWAQPVGRDTVYVTLVYQPQEIDLNVDVNHAQTNGLTYLADQGGDMADQVGAYTFRMKCMAVPQCP